MAREIISERYLPDDRITQFIRSHHVLTLATAMHNIPYCSACFYVYVIEGNYFVFTTDIDTRHGHEMLTNDTVSAAVSLETKIIGKIRGVQITGKVVKATGKEQKHAKKAYLKRFPVASLLKTTYWLLYPDFIKLTDNRLGFGTKLIWKRQPM